ncbi:hypothetical protein KI688_006485 [Linnemannia hyalina]|uniref:Dynamin N-terminal domain-containing protein n=1 Tax=Linnemannia hyalina TaxID=64524 RepID=A0A9P8BNI7_9FUNG|nr:hypothetical protein KI688_006485 [Linnemannia hyalina]
MTVKTFNVLVLGETQSGKSTLLEALKLYADPTYKIDKSRIGSGNVSLTTEVRQESIKTRLPEYLVKKVDRSQHSEEQPKAQQHPVAYDVFITKDKDTYEDELNARREYQPPVQGNPWSSEELTFNIIDTPGLNDTKDQDEHHVFKIISELGGQSLDLVLVTVSRGAFTQGLQQVLRSYMDLFPQLGDIMAFVHTRVDYLELHPDMTNFQSYMKEKVATLSAIMGRSSFPHFWIDCDFETTKPVRKCITNNTLRRILRLAVENKSVVMLRSKTLNKTPKMKEIDRIIKNQVRAVIQAIEKTLEFNDKDEGVLLQGVYIRATEINELQAKINILQDLQKSYQIDELGLLHEERVDDIQRPLAMGVSCPARYAGEHTIDDAVVWCENFMFCGLDGEQSSGSWEGTFKKKTQGYNGYYHVKLYAKKSSRFKAEIDVIATEIADLEVQLQRRVNESDLPPKEALSKIQSFVDAHNRHMEVIRLASADTLHHDLFVELVNARAFAGPTSERPATIAAPVTIAAPTNTIAVPTDTIAAPTDTIAAAANTIAVPKHTIPVSTGTIAAPTDTIAAATDTIAAPTDTIAVPTDTIAAAANTIAVPKHTIAVSTGTIAAPTDTIAAAANTIAVPKHTIAVSTGTIAAATDTIAAATDTIAAPTDTIAVPTDTIAAAANTIAVPKHTIAVSTGTIAAPTDTIAAAANTIAVPKHTIAVSTGTIAAPTDTIAAAANTIAVPKHTIAVSTGTIAAATNTIAAATDTIAAPTDTTTSTPGSVKELAASAST